MWLNREIYFKTKNNKNFMKRYGEVLSYYALQHKTSRQLKERSRLLYNSPLGILPRGNVKKLSSLTNSSESAQ